MRAVLTTQPYPSLCVMALTCLHPQENQTKAACQAGRAMEELVSPGKPALHGTQGASPKAGGCLLTPKPTFPAAASGRAPRVTPYCTQVPALAHSLTVISSHPRGV